ncbi:kinase domain-containing protein [Apiospora hydei]|uniref:Kinase domain-containing protein n=1 Tax=Apiospora hydei TaxID=1337664 RepID=A0ABR1XAR7_9PEZI
MSFATTTTPHDRDQDAAEPHAACPCGNDNVCQCAIAVLRDKGMQALLLASQEDVSDERLRFVPRDSIIQEISPDFISTVLQHISNKDADIASLISKATNRIGPRADCHCKKPFCTGSRVLFASLLFAGLHGILEHFIRAALPAICDSSLWGELTQEKEGLGDGDPIFRQIQELQGDRKDLFFYWMCQLIPLCFVNEEANGQINKLELTGDEWDDPGSSKSNFDKELETNNAAARSGRILPLLAAFEHRDSLCLLFPWAELGDLRNIWQKYSPFRDGGAGQHPHRATWYSPQWLVGECYGIASALADIHGRGDSTPGKRPLMHADIKPDNILGFYNGDSVSLKLADFGHSHILPASSAEVMVSTLVKARSYRAPEYDIRERVTTKYDVWSLGCLFLDFVTWALLGWKGFEEFRERRLNEENDPKADYGSLIEDTFFKRVTGRRSALSLSKFRPGYEPTTSRADSKSSFTKSHTFSLSFQGFSRPVLTRVRDTVTQVRFISVAYSSCCFISSRPFSLSPHLSYHGEAANNGLTKQHMMQLRANSGCDEQISQLLDVVESKMLVSDCDERAWSDAVRDMLSQIPPQRLEAEGNHNSMVLSRK